MPQIRPRHDFSHKHIDCFPFSIRLTAWWVCRLEVQKMVTPVFLVNHTLMLGHNIPQQPANALYDLTMHVANPQGMLLLVRTAGNGGVDGRCAGHTKEKGRIPSIHGPAVMYIY